MNRSDRCHDNPLAERFLTFLECERIKRRIYTDRVQTRPDGFDYIEFSQHTLQRHGSNNQRSPAEFELQYFLKNGIVSETWGDAH
jgi:putative transposase